MDVIEWISFISWFISIWMNARVQAFFFFFFEARICNFPVFHVCCWPIYVKYTGNHLYLFIYFKLSVVQLQLSVGAQRERNDGLDMQLHNGGKFGGTFFLMVSVAVTHIPAYRASGRNTMYVEGLTMCGHYCKNAKNIF